MISQFGRSDGYNGLCLLGPIVLRTNGENGMQIASEGMVYCHRTIVLLVSLLTLLDAEHSRIKTIDHNYSQDGGGTCS